MLLLLDMKIIQIHYLVNRVIHKKTLFLFDFSKYLLHFWECTTHYFYQIWPTKKVSSFICNSKYTKFHFYFSEHFRTLVNRASLAKWNNVMKHLLCKRYKQSYLRLVGSTFLCIFSRTNKERLLNVSERVKERQRQPTFIFH